MTLDELADAIHRNAEWLAEHVVHGWRRVAVDEPWLELPDTMDFDHLPRLLGTVAEAGLRTAFDPAACREVVAQAAIHGETRRDQAFREAYLYSEYLLLRRSLWREVRERAQADLATVAITRIDSLLGLATLASLRGYHRAAYESKGEWPDTLERLLEEYPLTERSA